MQTQTIGQRLTEARERMGARIEEAAESTHVRAEYLRALEDDLFENIPLADVYRRGYIKIYCRYLRLDAERLLADFAAGPLAAHHVQTDDDVPDNFGGTPDAAPAPTPGAYTPPAGGTNPHRIRKSKRVFVIAAILGVLVVAAAAAVIFLEKPAKTTTPTPDANAAAAPKKTELSYSMTVTAHANCRITITQKSDGKKVCDENFLKDGRKDFAAQGAVEVKTSVGAQYVWVVVERMTFYGNNPNADAFTISEADIAEAKRVGNKESRVAN